MWWHRPLLAALVVTAALSLAGCGIEPLYGTTAGGSRVGAVMAGIDVTPIPGRVGQRLRNELIFANTGGSAPPAQSNYKLDIVIKESLISELVQITGNAQGQVYELDATFKLITHDGRVVLEGTATSHAALERFQTIFSNVRARVDAENRAASTVAESIKVRVAAYLSQAA
jgi:LPS-assembly lipoprotein